MWKFLLIVFIGYTSAALTDEEVKIEFTKYIMKCSKDHPVEMSELMSLQKMIVPKNQATKCLVACAYRAAGSLDDKGMLDKAKSYQIAEELQKGDDTRIANAKKLADICSKVNDETVSDGDKGCDRAALIFKCAVENAPKLGFKI